MTAAPTICTDTPPHRRVIKRVIIVALVATPIVYSLWQYYSLRRYQQFIQQQYAAEIKLLESSMLAWPEDRFKDEVTHDRVEEIEATLKRSFSVGDFYHAGWSYDSHHNAGGTGLPGGGFTSVRIFSTTDASGQSLYYGRSFAGDELLVIQKWVPDAPLMKHFELVLYRDAVDSRMASQ